MIFDENRLPADDSHEISYLIFSKIWKDIVKFVVCYSCDWHFKIIFVSFQVKSSIFCTHFLTPDVSKNLFFLSIIN